MGERFHIGAERPDHLPTERQIAYAGKLAGIRARGQLERFVAYKLGRTPSRETIRNLTRHDWAKAIDALLVERRGLR